MGFLRLHNDEGLALGLPDGVIVNVFTAAKAGHDRGDFVSLCSYEPEEGRYVQVDVCVFVPEVTDAVGETVVKESHMMLLAPVYTDGGDVSADDALVDQVLQVMEKTDGCIVLTSEDELVLDPDAAIRIIRSARRVNPFEGIIFPDPNH
ncbi:hypothetical protein [Corynebacterium cystitidis]|uniref:hypothetical protein n=1 Tax=Corynebacterium cystitidis TaxID=35757 RepID=UPI00211DDAF6|nr:hypothetical protein [Corynebacterium cystitidis]